jgi:CHAD domain-containing protein
MSFQFKKTESPAKAIKRVCRAHLGLALGWMQNPRRPAAIHSVRKEIKKTRAILRLIRTEVGVGAYRKVVKPLRQAAQHLAASRDARVMLGAFKILTKDSPSRFPKIHAALQKHCRRETRRSRKAHSLASARRLLRKSNQRIRRLQFSAEGWAAMAPGLHRSYGRGRNQFVIVFREPTAENFHAWRKQVKTLAYLLRLLAPNWPARTHRFMKKLERLGDQLGDAHDLARLQQFLMESGAAQIKEVKRLNHMMAARQKLLHSSALKLGSELYSETPLAACRRMEKDWRVWRGESAATKISRPKKR